MSFTVFDLVGLIGVALLLISYFLLQIGRLDPKKYAYSLMNLCGAFGIFLSLVFDWNLAAGLIEIFWMAISLMGLWRIFSERHRVRTEPEASVEMRRTP